MTSYFEKLTSINASSLTSLHKQTKDSSLKSSGINASSSLSELSTAIEELKSLNSKLELDLKCEHDEKADLVGLKVGLENEVLNLREVNERLEFQVEQLRVEKDKIHHVLAKVREEGGGGESRITGLFIASSGSGEGGMIGGGGFGVMKKFPSLDDLCSPATTSPLFLSPSTSPPPGLVRVTTPTSLASGGPLERITEEDETLLESLVLSNNKNTEPSASSSSTFTKTLLAQHQQPRVEDLLKKIAFLESENIRLTRKKFVCSKCKRRSGNGRRNPTGGLIFEDEGLVLSAIDDDDDSSGDEDYDDGRSSACSSSSLPTPKHSSLPSSSDSGVIKIQANSILEIQRKVLDECLFEFYHFVLVHSDELGRSSSALAAVVRKDDRKIGKGVE